MTHYWSKVKKMKRLSILTLAVKYYIQGDSWKDAKQYAQALVLGFRRYKE